MARPFKFLISFQCILCKVGKISFILENGGGGVATKYDFFMDDLLDIIYAGKRVERTNKKLSKKDAM